MLCSDNFCSAMGFNGSIAKINDLFSVYPVGAVDVTLDVPSDTWEGEGVLMRCTSNLDIARVYWYKRESLQTRTRVFLYVKAKVTGQHIAANDLLNTTVQPNKPRAVGRLVNENVYELYINKTALSDESAYTCKVDPGGGEDSKYLTVNGE